MFSLNIFIVIVIQNTTKNWTQNLQTYEVLSLQI